ncbi:low affinity Fe/Cu permease [Chryseobacterium sp. AG844]|nr:low affinity Fe/Cu permease [Chryseobacterium sp. AG844]
MCFSIFLNKTKYSWKIYYNNSYVLKVRDDLNHNFYTVVLITCITILFKIVLFMKKKFFERFSDRVVCITGSPGAFMGATLLVVVWAVCGPVFNYSETWQLVINTGTTIITFLMVFLIQKTQNKDSKAIQIKLNELIASYEKASNRLVDIEDLTEEELDKLHKYYEKLGQLSQEKEHSQDPVQE